MKKGAQGSESFYPYMTMLRTKLTQKEYIKEVKHIVELFHGKITGVYKKGEV